MKKKIVYLVMISLIAVLLSACGSKQEGSDQKTSSAQEKSTAEASVKQESTKEESVQESTKEESKTEEPAAAPTEEPTAAPTEEPEEEPAESVNPYAWQGLEDMPKCHYLDLFCSYHYFRTDENYTMGFVSEQKEAADGINSYTEGSGNRSWSIDGKVLSVNDNAKIYMEYDMGESLAELAKDNLAEAMEKGINTTGRVFNGQGTDSIPEYSEHGDTDQYEYYEYVTDMSTDTSEYSMTERFYMKDGDVFAIFQSVSMGETNVQSTQVIKSISGEIPEGTFDLPDLTGYEKYE